MKKKKTKIGIIIILGLVLFILKGNCELNELNETIYLNPNDWISRSLAYQPTWEKGVRFQWSFRTYDEPFMVRLYSYANDQNISEYKTSDSGEGDVNNFGFRNIDVIGGYINIRIWIKEEIDYTILLYFLIPLFIVSIIIIGLYYQRYQRQKQLKGMDIK